MLKYDCVIIGSGIAGMTAAIYLKRANKNVLVLENNAPGGQMNKTASIENYPGFKEIDGPSLSMTVFEQMRSLGVEYKYGNVTEITEVNDNYKVTTDLETFETKGIIIATGRRPLSLNLPNEENFVNKGVSWCGLCDGMFFKNKEVIVVGGGNSAVEEAIYLSGICNKVRLVYYKNNLKADKFLVEKLNSLDNIEIVYNANSVGYYSEEDQLKGLVVEINGSKEIVKGEGIFYHVGHVPNTDFLKDVNLENGYVKVDNTMKTNKERIYACGDVVKKEIYQIATSIAEGAIAATSLQKNL